MADLGFCEGARFLLYNLTAQLAIFSLLSLVVGRSIYINYNSQVSIWSGYLDSLCT